MSSKVASSEVVRVRADGFKSLIVWQKAMDLTVEVYKVTENFPKTELYGLVSQLRRASSSIPANIAEGYGRNFTKEERHFLSIAYGSLMEVETFLILSYRLGFMSAGLFRKIDATRNEVGKLVIGYRRSRQD